MYVESRITLDMLTASPRYEAWRVNHIVQSITSPVTRQMKTAEYDRCKDGASKLREASP